MEQELFWFNTIFFYILLFLIAGTLIYSYLRIFFRRQRMIKGSLNDVPFEKMDRGSRQKMLKALLMEFDNLQQALAKLDEELLRLAKEDYISVVLLQEWCGEDKKGKELQPCRTRPVAINIKWSGGKIHIDLTAYDGRQFLTSEENKLLFWGVTDRCRLMIPFKRYRTEVKRTTRKFCVENNVEVWWEDDTVVKEDYCIEIW